MGYNKIIHTLQHRTIRSVGNGEHMGGYFMPLDALIPLHDLLRVDRQLLVGIHHHAEETGVCLQGKKPF
jgi:hypothetical protein